MISSKTTVTLSRVELWVARITQGQHVAVVTSPSRPRFGVVSTGLQGPAGTLSDNVLQSVEQTSADAAAARESADAAGLAAATAQEAATGAVESVNTLMRSLQNAFEYHAGAIGVDQE